MRMKKGDGNGGARDSAETAREWKTPVNMQIFVSHRIDLDAELIDNPLYVPVRCGAVYDRRENISMLGDDTGDNISEKRLSFCEFTVQYWAWKNVQAQYYGLCHYRRYLSFADRHFSRVNAHNMIEEPLLTRRAKAKYGLLDAEAMRREIARYDIIISEPGLVERIPTYTGKQAHTVRQLWEAHAGLFVAKSSVDDLLERIDRLSPAYSQSAREYFAGNRHFGYNCYVMKRAYFEQLCGFQFPILFDLEKTLPKETMEAYPRIIGYMGEMLYGVFVYRQISLSAQRTVLKQIVFFEDATKIRGPLDAAGRFFRAKSRSGMRKAFHLLCPVGTARRARIKQIMHRRRGRIYEKAV